MPVVSYKHDPFRLYCAACSSWATLPITLFFLYWVNAHAEMTRKRKEW